MSRPARRPVPFSIASTLLVLTVAPGAVAAQPRTFPTQSGPMQITTAAEGLVHPWALAFLPDGRMLVTERPGRLRLVKDGELSPPVANLPQVYASGQGGLLDVVIDRDHASNRVIYFCFAQPYRGGGRTAAARAVLDAGATPRLSNVKVIFEQAGPPSRGNHFGCRIAQARDGNLFITTGDHFTDRDLAQKLDNDIGKIIRITPEGAIPSDNPFSGRNDARAAIWSYGHRNAQGAAIHPQTGALWQHEHGARGGDEINIPRPGLNYGWPLISHGVNYDGSPVGSGRNAMPGLEQPIWHWTPSIAPSGMAFYTGDLIPAWKGNLFVGALAGQMLVRLSLDGETVTHEERLFHGLSERIRDVRQGPDGALYLLTDDTDGRVLRVAPVPR